MLQWSDTVEEQHI